MTERVQIHSSNTMAEVYYLISGKVTPVQKFKTEKIDLSYPEI